MEYIQHYQNTLLQARSARISKPKVELNERAEPLLLKDRLWKPSAQFIWSEEQLQRKTPVEEESGATVQDGGEGREMTGCSLSAFLRKAPGYALVAAGDEEAVLVQRQLQPLLGVEPSARAAWLRGSFCNPWRLTNAPGPMRLTQFAGKAALLWLSTLALPSFLPDPFHAMSYAKVVNPFGVALFQYLAKKEVENVLISPMSISVCLSMVAAGATEGSGTQKELMGMGGGLKALPEASSMQMANSAWVRMAIKPEFLADIQKTFQADAFPLPSPDPMRINNWVKEKTQGLIPSLFEVISDKEGAISFIGKIVTPELSGIEAKLK
ncbi:unnamed protein product [Effrenium voratum]|nr:unnamed protein product [Effrenium voratum]